MKKKTLSQAKNMMRRALNDLVDRPPSQSQQMRIRAHFESRCCYCESSALPHDGHLDHADPKAGNALGNLLLACKTCNGNEKREASWQDFLRAKCGDDGVAYEVRLARIRAWQDAVSAEPRAVAPEVALALADAEASIAAYEAAFNRVRAAILTSDARAAV